jgi:hypothetical protein
MRRSLSAVIVLLCLSACTGGGQAPSQSASQEPATQPTAATDKALEPLFGTWGLDPAKCDQVLTISKTRFEGAENGCDIASFADNGDGSYTAAMTCSSQGQSASENIKMRPVFAPTGEGVELTYLDRDNLETLLLRCGAAKTGEN